MHTLLTSVRDMFARQDCWSTGTSARSDPGKFTCDDEGSLQMKETASRVIERSRKHDAVDEPK